MAGCCEHSNEHEATVRNERYHEYPTHDSFPRSTLVTSHRAQYMIVFFDITQDGKQLRALDYITVVA